MERHDGVATFVISARLPKQQRLMLILWTLVWTACGAAFLREAILDRTPAMRVPLMIMLAFWAYFEYTILRALLWRLKGFELWRVMEGELIIKNSLFHFGNADRFFVANIQRLGLLNVEEDSWKWQWNDSFWTRGAERLGFEYLGRKVGLGRGLSADEARKLAPLLATELKRERKSAQQ